MTEQFYSCFLVYIGQTELQRLRDNLQRNKFSVPGYRMKSVSVQSLAKYISQNERQFSYVIKKVYGGTTQYNSKNEILLKFSPDNALSCLAVLFQGGYQIEEAELMCIMRDAQRKQENSKSEEKVSTESKEQKKSDEFRQKYLNTYKLLEKEKKDNDLLRKEKDELLSQLQTQVEDFEVLKSAWNAEKVQYELEIEKIKTKLKEMIDTEKMTQRNVLVLSDKQLSLSEIPVIELDNIAMLGERARSCTEVLIVENDIPFSVKRTIRKMPVIAQKLHPFSTYTELMKYLEKRGCK